MNLGFTSFRTGRILRALSSGGGAEQNCGGVGRGYFLQTVNPLPTYSPQQNLVWRQRTVTSLGEIAPQGAYRASSVPTNKDWGGAVYGYFSELGVAGSRPARRASACSSVGRAPVFVPCATRSPHMVCRGGRGQLLRLLSGWSPVRFRPWASARVAQRLEHLAGATRRLCLRLFPAIGLAWRLVRILLQSVQVRILSAGASSLVPEVGQGNPC